MLPQNNAPIITNEMFLAIHLPLLNTESGENNGSLVNDSNLFCLVAKTAPINPIHNVICWTNIGDAGIPGRPSSRVKISTAGKSVRTLNTPIVRRFSGRFIYSLIFIN